MSFVSSPLAGEPFGALELGDGVVEGEAMLGEDRLGLAVVVVDLVVAAAAGVEAGVEAVALGLEGGGELTRLERVDESEQLVGLGEVVELEGCFQRFEEAVSDARVRDSELAVGEAAFGGGERLGRPVLGA